jgi:hypothetical protein
VFSRAKLKLFDNICLLCRKSYKKCWSRLTRWMGIRLYNSEMLVSLLHSLQSYLPSIVVSNTRNQLVRSCYYMSFTWYIHILQFAILSSKVVVL